MGGDSPGLKVRVAAYSDFVLVVIFGLQVKEMNVFFQEMINKNLTNKYSLVQGGCNLWNNLLHRGLFIELLMWHSPNIHYR